GREGEGTPVHRGIAGSHGRGREGAGESGGAESEGEDERAHDVTPDEPEAHSISSFDGGRAPEAAPERSPSGRWRRRYVAVHAAFPWRSTDLPDPRGRRGPFAVDIEIRGKKATGLRGVKKNGASEETGPGSRSATFPAHGRLFGSAGSVWARRSSPSQTPSAS